MLVPWPKNCIKATTIWHVTFKKCLISFAIPACTFQFLVYDFCAVADEIPPKSILILEEADANRGPFYTTMFAALRDRLYASQRPLSLYVENLELPYFEGREYEESLKRFLQQKYRDRKVDVVITIGQGALTRGIEWRSELWPTAFIAFSNVVDAAIEPDKLPDYVTGRTTRLRLADMLAAARAVVPGLDRVVIVGASFDTQPAIHFRQFASEIPTISRDVEIVDLTGLPMAKLRERLSALPEKSAILYTPIYSDGAGAQLLPAEAIRLLSETANRPIIANVETYLNRGAIGGYMLFPSVIGEEVADLALEILNDRQPSQIPIAVGNSLRPVFNWDGMQRWSVDEASLPPGSEIRNRALPIWEQYPAQTAAAIALVLFQSAFIVALLYEHRRRRVAEIDARARSYELARLNRRATAGELSASIAHEVNQPLGAILANTEACEQLLSAPDPDMKLIEEILTDIKRENQRASEVVTRLRRMMRRADPQKEDIELNDAIRDLLKFASAPARAHDIDLTGDLIAQPLLVHVDPIQLQQVVLNLILNAIDAIRDAGFSSARKIVVRTRLVGRNAEIAVSDTGPGITADKLERIFEPFFTTKPQGMGMGLSITRTIIELHGGSISAESEDGGGSVFRVQLPLNSGQ